MTLRGRFFAMTYDRQMAKVEKAGLRSHRNRCSPAQLVWSSRSGRAPGATCPSTVRPSSL